MIPLYWLDTSGPKWDMAYWVEARTVVLSPVETASNFDIAPCGLSLAFGACEAFVLEAHLSLSIV